MAEEKAVDWDGAIARARAEAPFLARSLDRMPDLARLLEQGEIDAALAWAEEIGTREPDLGVALRRERVALSTVLAIGDLAGALDLRQIVTALSDCADRSLDRAIADAIAKRVDGAESAGMVALALGKQGARELNYSSDIDPILLFDPDTLPRRAKDEPGEAARRYAQHVVKLLSENTADGFAFRVDLRLRPSSEVSPPAISLSSAQAHYESSALAWERAAFVRARAAAGDVAAGERFLETIKSFVWRSNLDFGAVAEIRRLTAQIRLNYDGPQEPGPGFDLKRGRGGIREIEFFAQTHQLIHGGRDPSLRVRGTRAALDALAESGLIPREDADELGFCYDRLRTLEHRLQMIHDRQTHSLPQGDALDAVARLDGLRDGDALVSELRELTERVGRSYDQLIGEEDARPVATGQPAPTEPVPSEPIAGLRGQLERRILGWRDGRYQSLRTPQALEAFDAIQPVLLDALTEASDPIRAMARWESMLEKASSAINLFHLLDARPGLLKRLVSTLTMAPTLADELGRRPELLDALIDRSALDLPGSVDEIAARMRELAQRDDYEAQLDSIRVLTSELRFALGVQLIEGRHDPLDIGLALSRAAEAGILVATQATAQEFAAAHGQIEGAELLALGLGRLGGGVLTHASDLDLVFLFTGSFDAQSDGARPLSATMYFNRLAQRVSGALSVPTAQGALYEVDTRLRPQGNQGPLAVSVDAFAKYQRESAWTWEHMALTRARALLGSGSARARLEQEIGAVLGAVRDRTALRKDVLKMRSEMAQHKPPSGALDVKLQRGGLVDLEFVIHFLQLEHGHRSPDIIEPDLGDALTALVAAGLVPENLIRAHALMTRMLIAGRLLAPLNRAPHPASALQLARSCEADSFAELLEKLTIARQSVAQVWAAVFEQQLEIE